MKVLSGAYVPDSGEIELIFFHADRGFLHKNGKSVQVGLSAQCMKKADGTVDAILILVQNAPHREVK